MFFGFSALAAALILATPDKTSALQAKQDSRELLLSCDAYDLGTQETTETTVFWTGLGNDSEWLDKGNWMYGYLPGIHKFNKIIMAANDVATVHCDATYMAVAVSLEARTGATLDVMADLNIGDQLLLKGGAAFTQSSVSHVAVGKNLVLSALYSISDQAQLSIALDLYMASNAILTINGDGTSVLASLETETMSQVHGELKYVLGPLGTGDFDVNGPLTIGSTTAKLTIDAASYTSGAGTIELIKYKSVTGAFDAAKVDITGLPAELLYDVRSESDGLYLDISSLESNPTTTPPTLSPTISTPSPTRSPTNVPTTGIPTANPISSPTVSPVVPIPQPTDSPMESTQSPSRGPTNVPTKSPTKVPSASPISSPTVSPTVSTPEPTGNPVEPTPAPTDNPVGDTVTRIVLSEFGFDPIVRTIGMCPAVVTASVVIDGAAYVGGPGRITLYECALINANYDLINIHLENFEDKGLWFEIAFNVDSISLLIKSLTSYSDYWRRVEITYNGEYPESTSTAHFPGFSWDTIPTWVRFRKNIARYEYSDAELESVANNHWLSWYGLGNPAHVKDVTQRIKGYNETHRTMLYWNAESYWGTTDVGFNDEWIAPGSGTGARALYDYNNPDMRDWWVDHAKMMTSDENIDGQFTDNTLSPECDNGGCDLERSVKALMIKRLALELPSDTLKVGNFLRQGYDGGNRFRLAYTDGSYFENQHKSTGLQPKHEGIIVSMQLAREASWKKKVVMWTGSRRNCGCGFNFWEEKDIPLLCKGFNGVDEEPTALLKQDLDKALGEFLMIVEEFSYINFNISPDANCEPWRWDTSGMEEFNRPLGQPLGPPLLSGHTFSRHFEHLSVKANVATEETTFIWH
mmetsp:Transcript_8534/g.19101  ORF Transcript_8534/g.19101 Transcript_8534/m.19101 type:complete len:864 (-) Transcript_8534:217-2808(-)|eukprot:CAMPEP_0172321788 /NCGR_PEP_ID=MMETSP1058-20130122/44294_1 /TAXON_ID=83371 /ORGANISM="Detonula confervacea, Strain CCMP 353" /LENGTH=863 /DNA_ID=CAMNT_0013037383 /DNA_START=72 /DNA_END=2663 /DNA_ORIENTATION=+